MILVLFPSRSGGSNCLIPTMTSIDHPRMLILAKRSGYNARVVTPLGQILPVGIATLQSPSTPHRGNESEAGAGEFTATHYIYGEGRSSP